MSSTPGPNRETPPTVSIGLPVYNGEATIGAALASLTAIRYPDLEIVISDNNSTDDTQAICSRYVKRDTRVRYIRQNRNLGALANFNFLARRCEAPFFMWAAADDRWEPDILSSLVSLLDANPQAVAAVADVRMVDQRRNEVARFRFGRALESASVVERLTWFLRKGGCWSVYGLMRTESLHRTHLFRLNGRLLWGGVGPDLPLIVELLALGPIMRSGRADFVYELPPAQERMPRALISTLVGQDCILQPSRSVERFGLQMDRLLRDHKVPVTDRLRVAAIFSTLSFSGYWRAARLGQNRMSIEYAWHHRSILRTASLAAERFLLDPKALVRRSHYEAARQLLRGEKPGVPQLSAVASKTDGPDTNDRA